MAGEKIPTETPLAYEYFKLYRDMPPGERSVRTLCGHSVDGKKRNHRVIGRWSSDHNWQERVKEWDAAQSKQAAKKAARKRQKDIQNFIDADFTIGEAVQRLAAQALAAFGRNEPCPFNALQFRQVLMGYKEGRSNLKELIGFLDKEAEKLGELGNTED